MTGFSTHPVAFLNLKAILLGVNPWAVVCFTGAGVEARATVCFVAFLAEGQALSFFQIWEVAWANLVCSTLVCLLGLKTNSF